MFLLRNGVGIHTNRPLVFPHPHGENFSNADFENARDRNITSFVVTPGGNIRKFFNTGRKDSYGKDLWINSKITTDGSVKLLSLAEKIALYYKYKTKWNNHLSSCDWEYEGYCEELLWPHSSTGVSESWNISKNSFLNKWANYVLGEKFYLY